jgi:cytochrome c-type biogenesis protein CcmE
MRYAIRVGVTAAIGIAFALVRGFHSLPETFAMSACAVGLAQGAAWLYGKHRVAGVAVAAVIAVGTLGGAAAYTVARHPGPIPYREVDALMAEPERWVGDTVKLHGYIELGSISARVEQQQVSHAFVLHVKDKRVAARFTGVVPDTFQDRAEVVATGRLTHGSDSYLFEATEVIAKCPSTYQTATGPQPASKFR